MATLFSDPFVTYLTPDGEPSVGDFFTFLDPNTNLKKTIFDDSAATTPIANPARTNERGQLPGIFLDGSYTVNRVNKDGVPLQSPSQLIGGAAGDVAFSDWSNGVSYNEQDIVTGSDNLHYVSIVNNNLNNDPTTSPVQWTQIKFIRVFNTNETYGQGDTVIGTDNKLHVSLVVSNQGNDPTSSAAEWSVPALLDTVSAYTKQQGISRATLVDAANIDWDLDTQSAAKVTLGGNRTMNAPTNQVDASVYNLRIIQDGTGTRTIIWNAVFKFGDAGTPTLSTAMNAIDIITFESDGTNMGMVGFSSGVQS